MGSNDSSRSWYLLHPATEVVQSIGVDIPERQELTKVIVLGKSKI